METMRGKWNEHERRSNKLIRIEKKSKQQQRRWRWWWRQRAEVNAKLWEFAGVSTFAISRSASIIPIRNENELMLAARKQQIQPKGYSPIQFMRHTAHSRSRAELPSSWMSIRRREEKMHKITKRCCRWAACSRREREWIAYEEFYPYQTKSQTSESWNNSLGFYIVHHRDLVDLCLTRVPTSQFSPKLNGVPYSLSLSPMAMTQCNTLSIQDYPHRCCSRGTPTHHRDELWWEKACSQFQVKW